MSKLGTLIMEIGLEKYKKGGTEEAQKYYMEAKEYLADVPSIYKSLKDRNELKIADSQENMANLLILLNQYNQAAIYLMAAERSYQSHFGNEDNARIVRVRELLKAISKKTNIANEYKETAEKIDNATETHDVFNVPSPPDYANLNGN